MSYDIYFVTRRDGQTWDEAMEALEDAADDSEGLVPAHLLEAWDRIVPEARPLLGESNLTDYQHESRELSQSGTGITLSLYGESFASIVERETGLTAYDPQRDRALTEGQPEGAAELMSRIAEDLRSRYGS
ncbi:hypothetical protein [Streptomyces sp. NPDC002176]|uniref:hypothetical protein n=1 Tax=Streptomyces sp. NPDC002176 TaxID=3364634 RepID=UPI00384A588A